MARTYSRDANGRFGTKNALQDKKKKKRTLKAQKDQLKGRKAKTGGRRLRKAPAGDKVSNKQQKRAYAKTKRRANGGG